MTSLSLEPKMGKYRLSVYQEVSLLMNDMRRPQVAIATVLMGLLVAALACSIGGTSQSSKPTVTISSPQAGSSFEIGQEVIVQSVAADAKGISRVELWVDGQPVHTQAVAPAVNAYTASQSWTPAVVGSHAVEVRAYNVDNLASDPAQVIVSVAEASAGVTPQPGDTPVSPAPAGTLTTTPTGTQAAGGSAIVTARIGLNVRSGPGVEYPVIGGLSEGQSAQVVGRNPEGTWWLIVYPSNSDGRGWVSAKEDYSTPSNTEQVPVAEVTPLPTSTHTPTGTPQPTPTYTPIPSATPVPLKPTIYSFTADRYTITAGESVLLQWDLANAQVAYLRYGGTEEGVVAPGNKTVSPMSTTAYRLVAINAAGETTAELTISVNPPAGPVELYNFVDQAPSASWYNNSGVMLPFPGSDVDNRGFALIREGFQLENGSAPARVLETHPKWTSGGGITGQYDVNVVIQNGDVFKTTIGFLAGAGAGDARWVLGYRESGSYHVLGDRNKAYNGSLAPFEVDLSPLAGKQVQFSLTVWANGSAAQDWAVWLNPRIERP